MCVPVMVALAVGAAVSSAVSAYQGSKERKAQGEFNARLAGIDASEVLVQGEEQANAVLRAGADLKGRQRAAFAGKGVDVNAGTASDIQAETDFFSQADAGRARDNAAQQAYRIRLQGANYQRGADNENPLASAALSLLGSSGTVAEKWTAYGAPKKAA